MKKLLYFTPLIFCFLLASCSEKYKDTTLYQSNGRAKPIVAILPVIDSHRGTETLDASRGLTWDISEELTNGIRKRIADSQRLYLLKEKGSLELAINLNTSDCRELSKQFSQGLNPAEFVVITELVSQEEKPYDFHRFGAKFPPKGEITDILSIDFRVRVFDVREQEPKLILQEIVRNNQLIAKPDVQFNYTNASYGSAAYSRTPMGIAHNKLVREVSGRIENYIRATKG